MISIFKLNRQLMKRGKTLRYSLIVVVFYCFHFPALCQLSPVIIPIVNGSFEDIPSCCKAPHSWENSGHEYETPPDVHPALDPDGNPFFGVTKMAKEGSTYLGMVVRSYGTHERIRQKLTKKLIKDSCYQFSIYLCRSEFYKSYVGLDSFELKDFTQPCMLRIWGVGKKPKKMHYLISSEPIRNTEWHKFKFKFRVPADIYGIELEAYYTDEIQYNGNILLDGMSDIELISCLQE